MVRACGILLLRVPCVTEQKARHFKEQYNFHIQNTRGYMNMLSNDVHKLIGAYNYLW